MKKFQFYKYNPLTLEHTKIKGRQIWFSLVGVLTLISTSFMIGRYSVFSNPKIVEERLEYEELLILVDNKENDRMSPKNLYEYMKQIGIKFPEIVWSQSAVESRFMSQICQENHNFFGMKRATLRPNTQTGEQYDHATYDNWKMSTLDYALWQCYTGVVKLKTEEQYFSYLDGRYAESATYVSKVKEIRNNFDHYLEYYEDLYQKTIKLDK